MSKKRQHLIAAAALAVALAIGVGAALAGGGLGFGNDRQAFLDNAAKRLGVTSAQLKAALQGAYDDRLDAAVAKGTITQDEADALKQRAKDDGLPLLGGRRGGFGPEGHGPGGFGHQRPALAAAATYLGVTEAELRTDLRSGKTLAQLAKDKGKSVDGLKQALSAAAKAKLDAAVKAGRLTQTQADELSKRLTEHLDDLVNGSRGPRGDHDGDRWGGPPPAGSQAPGAYAPLLPAGSPA